MQRTECVQALDPLAIIIKQEEKQLLQYKKKENTPPKLSTLTHNSFCAVYMVQLPCHHTVFQLPQRDKTMTNRLMGFLLNRVLFLTEKNASALPV